MGSLPSGAVLSSQQVPAGQAPGSHRPGTAPAASLLQAVQAHGASLQHEVEQRAQQQAHDVFAPPPSPTSARAAAASSSMPRGAERPTVDISADRPAFLGRQPSGGADIGGQRSEVGCDAGDRPAAGVSTGRPPVSQQQQEQQWSAEAAAAIAEARAARCPDLSEPSSSKQGAVTGLVESSSHGVRGGAMAAEDAHLQHNAAAPAVSLSQALPGSASRTLHALDDSARSDNPSVATGERRGPAPSSGPLSFGGPICATGDLEAAWGQPTGALRRPQSACRPPSSQQQACSDASDMQHADPSRPGDQPIHASPQAGAAAAEGRQGKDNGGQSGPLQAEERDHAAVRSAMTGHRADAPFCTKHLCSPMGCSLTSPGAQYS